MNDEELRELLEANPFTHAIADLIEYLDYDMWKEIARGNTEEGFIELSDFVRDRLREYGWTG